MANRLMNREAINNHKQPGLHDDDYIYVLIAQILIIRGSATAAHNNIRMNP